MPYANFYIENINRQEHKIIENNVCQVIPNFRNETIKKAIVTNSIIGYCMLIFSWQKAHLPRKNKYERTGILCQAFKRSPHLGHFEGGKTILSSANERKMTTL